LNATRYQKANFYIVETERFTISVICLLSQGVSANGEKKEN